MRILRNQEIEEIAASRLAELQQRLGRPLSPPIPIDLIAEKVLGLDFLWEAIDELPGEKVFGGLIAKKRLIVLNENRKGLFVEKPGLERSTKGHEMGHWKTLDRDDEGRELLRKIQSRADEPDEARAVNRYAAALSMPAEMIRADALKIDRTHWPNLHRLAEKCEVTISALRVRLEQLGLIYVDENKKIHESRDAASGQMMLGF